MPEDFSPPIEASPAFRSGYVAIVGWPNVGKSTLLNALLEAKLSIVSPKPQTTAAAILGIRNEPDAQIVFLDTPGWLTPDDAYQAGMRKAISRSVYDDADVILWLTAPGAPDAESEIGIALEKTRKPVVAAVNKVDHFDKAATERSAERLRSVSTSDVPLFLISARSGQGLDALVNALKGRLPAAPPYFPTDQITDRWERFYVRELIREQIFSLFEQEIPHATAVLVDEFREQEGRKDLIRVSLIVESDSQKQILVGKKGAGIRRLGMTSREAIEQNLGRPVFLELTVKVKKNWRKDALFVKDVESQR